MAGPLNFLTGGERAMDNVAEPATRLDTCNPLSKWVAEMQSVVSMVSSLLEESERHRAAAESAQREHSELREEFGRLRTELDRQRGELERQRAATESALHERDELRSEVASLQADNERLRGEQVEAGESAAKLLGEMKELVTQVAHKFQGPSKSSPFAREPRPPQS
jgi:chromosome segregation ATPase